MDIVGIDEQIPQNSCSRGVRGCSWDLTGIISLIFIPLNELFGIHPHHNLGCKLEVFTKSREPKTRDYVGLEQLIRLYLLHQNLSVLRIPRAQTLRVQGPK